jgi:hypothetical protein
MLTCKRFALVVALMAAAASPALAGTKFATNLVPESDLHPPPNPTLSAKSQIKMADKGTLTIALAGVTTAAGELANTSTTYNDAVGSGAPPALDGTEYIAIVKAYMPGVEFLAPVIEVPVPVNLKKGKGKTTLVLGNLFGLLGTSGRSFEVRGVEVWGPLGAAAAGDCQAIVAAPIPVGIPNGLNPGVCRDADGGVRIGISGLSIPVPAP